MPPLSPATWDEVFRTFTFQAGFNTTTVQLGAILLGIAAGIVGAFSMLRKRSLMSDVLSHATLPGIAFAFLLLTYLGAQGRAIPPLLIGGAISGIIGVLTVQWLARGTRLGEDTAMGVVLSVFFGAGVVLLSVIQNLSSGNQGGLKSFIYGQTAAMHTSDAALMGIIALIAALVAILLHKELTLICFNDAFAKVGGWPVTLLDLTIMALVILVTIAGLQAVGLILVVAMLMIPPAAARFWTDRITILLILSAIIGALSGYLGASISALLPRSPAGAVIVLSAGSLFLFSMFFAPNRGILASFIRRSSLSIRIARDHLLRALRDNETELQHDQFWTNWLARRAAIAQGLIIQREGRLALTADGRAEADRLIHNHRLWEQYLVTHADIAASHVDWSADTLEHILSPALIVELEKAVRDRKGRAS